MSGQSEEPKVSAVSVVKIGEDSILMAKLDEPVPPGTKEIRLIIRTADAPETAAPTAAWCACNRYSCGVFFF